MVFDWSSRLTGCLAVSLSRLEALLVMNPGATAAIEWLVGNLGKVEAMR